MTRAMSFGINDPYCLHVTTGNADEKDDSIYELSRPDANGFRTITKAGQSFQGAIRGKVGDRQDVLLASRTRPGGAAFGTKLDSGEWVIPCERLEVGDRMAIEIAGLSTDTLPTRPIKQIEIM